MKKYRKYIIGLLSIILLVIIDQISKHIAVQTLKEQPSFSIIPKVLSFHYLENHGAAFGIMQNATLFFILLTVVLLGVFVYCYYRIPFTRHFYPLLTVLIFFISGAIGNFIDRIYHSYVVDFIYFEPINFPIFNIADIYVTCSCIIFFLLLFFYYKEDELTFLRKR